MSAMLSISDYVATFFIYTTYTDMTELFNIILVYMYVIHTCLDLTGFVCMYNKSIVATLMCNQYAKSFTVQYVIYGLVIYMCFYITAYS